MSNIVSDENLAWIPTVIILSIVIVSLFSFEMITRKTNYFDKLPYWFLMLSPFVTIAIIILISILFNADIFIILLVAGIPFAILASFSFIIMRRKLMQKKNQAKKTIDKYHKFEKCK